MRINMEYVLDVAFNAVVSDIFGRIISPAIDNLLGPSSPDDGARDAHRLHLEQLLYSISSAVAEAEGRDITHNLDLLAQLQALNDAKYRGRFALEFAELEDVRKNAAVIGDDDAADDTVVTTTRKRNFAVCSLLNAAKRARRVKSLIRGGGGDGDGAMKKSLANAVEALEPLIRYLQVFILSVHGQPRRNNVARPLTTTRYMDRRVFGRHVERERVVAFLLQPAPRSTGLSALAVVGARMFGKDTLVRYVCDDTRVRDHFARVEWFRKWDVLERGGWRPEVTQWESGGLEYLAGVRSILEEPRFRLGRCLLVFEAAEPVDESAWAALLASSFPLPDGSKLLFTCRDANLARILGTVEPLVLRPLPQEEYWYFFKGFAFDGVEPRDHPRMAAVGRDISERLRCSLFEARALGTLLRANFNVRFWRWVLDIIVSPAQRQKQHFEVLYLLLRSIISSTRLLYYSFSNSTLRSTLPKLTLEEVLSPPSASSSSSRTSCLGVGDTEEGFTIQICRATPYTDHWYGVTVEFLEEGEDAGPPLMHASVL